MPTRRPLTDSPFDTLEKTFRLLVTGPRPLALEGEKVVGLPERLIPLDELKAIQLHPSTSHQVRHDTLAELVRRARDSETWIGPGRRGPSRRAQRGVVARPGLSRSSQGHRGRKDWWPPFVTSTSPAPASPSTWCGDRGKQPSAWCAWNWPSRPARHLAHPRDPTPTVGAPDLVLIKAVGLGVVAADSPELIGSTRLGAVGLDEAAAALHVGYWAAHKRRAPGRGGRGRVAGLRRTPLPALCPRGSRAPPFS
jgi:hypothetical protein